MSAKSSDDSRNRRLHRISVASSRLKPLAYGDHLKIRRDDLAVFSAAAEVFDHIIIVRATNERSLPYIGQKLFAPKPIDCKPKTADADCFVPDGKRFVECAGLVVDPTIVGDRAFPNDKKRLKAREAWGHFLKDKTKEERASKVFRRRGTKGFFAVDLHKASRHYGCLMLSVQDIPAEDFSTAGRGWAQFRRNHMRYIHGDYDLYGLIDLESIAAGNRGATAEGGRHAPKVLKEKLHGMPHYYTEQFPQIQRFLNSGFGVEMIQHAAQDNVAHQSDLLYVFYPEGTMYHIDASADAIREIYDLLFKQDVTP